MIAGVIEHPRDQPQIHLLVVDDENVRGRAQQVEAIGAAEQRRRRMASRSRASGFIWGPALDRARRVPLVPGRVAPDLTRIRMRPDVRVMHSVAAYRAECSARTCYNWEFVP